MAETINNVYDDAVASGLLPGISVFAGGKDGKTIYTHSAGVASLHPSRTSSPTTNAFTPSTVAAIASMTKLLTSVSILQLVQDGLLDLDADVKPLLPQIGSHGIIITPSPSSTSPPVLTPLPPTASPITTRMLLSHTSGHEYDWFSPALAAWRASRGEEVWVGKTVEDKCVLPLVFPPGEGFAYGPGHDWAGRIVEVVSGKTLDGYMRERIWDVLGVERFEAGFYFSGGEDETSRGMREVAGLSTLSEGGEGPAVDLSGFDILFGGRECLGGGGGYVSARAYYAFLSAVFRRDERLLGGRWYEELFRPQLSGEVEERLNEYLVKSQMHVDVLGSRIPEGTRKNWSFAGLVAMGEQEGRFGKGTVVWGGVPSCQWWMDDENGICGVAVCQVLPPMCPSIMALHEQFQRGVYEIVKGKKSA